MGEIPVFRLEVKGVRVMEWTVNPKMGLALKTALLGAGAIAIGVGAKYAVDWIDSTMTPQYVVNGASVPHYAEPTPEWVRPTDWKKKYSK